MGLHRRDRRGKEDLAYFDESNSCHGICGWLAKEQTKEMRCLIYYLVCKAAIPFVSFSIGTVGRYCTYCEILMQTLKSIFCVEVK